MHERKAALLHRVVALTVATTPWLVAVHQIGAQVWEQAVAGAKKEARVVVSGVTGAEARKLLTEGFQTKFPGIHVEYSGLTGRDTGPRTLAERRAGKKLWDVYIGGVNTPHTTLKPAGALLDLRPAFILPEIKGNKYWHGGLDFGFTDKEKRYVYAASANIRAPVYVNRSNIPSAQLNSPRQLIDPRFKGKITMNDPREAGPGAADHAVLMFAYGEDFVRKLLTEQGTVFTRNLRQQAEWVIRGRYPVGVGMTEGSLTEFLAQGVGEAVELVSAPEVESWNASASGVALFEGAPHPNAARVYINWFLSRETQEQWARVTGYNSRRTDVTPVEPKMFPKPERLNQYVRNDESWEEIRLRAQQLARSLIK
jgi:iron(III) transport system substrate-binding protein